MLPTLQSPELFVGLCSPLGTDNSKIVELLRSIFLQYGYQSEPYKVTNLMKSITLPNYSLVEKPKDKRYDSYIKYANEVRSLTEEPAALAYLCSLTVRNSRRKLYGKGDHFVQKKAYTFEQFKRPEEIMLLRQIYGKLFVLVGVHSDQNKRLSRLADDISSDTGSGRPTNADENAARELMTRDQKEVGIKSGQRLSDTFSMSDIFVNVDDLDAAEKTIKRFLSGLFGSNQVSPTRAEYGMYLAKTASLRSTDLSRQVGAAICTKNGEIITLGSNEVPKAGGGTYWSGDVPDARDHILGKDENERIKRSLLVDIIRRLKDGKYLDDSSVIEEAYDFVVAHTVPKESDLRDSQIMDLLEFGRIIHAEMSAICDAARTGKPLKGSILYCTTFPCHICAKHIVASGIDKVVYIEPYEKSYAFQLHPDSINTSSDRPEPDKVVFEPFIGISPYRYRDIFERSRRKRDDGTFLEWADSKPTPNVKFTVATFLKNEETAISLFSKKLIDLANSGKIAITDLQATIAEEPAN